jgi:ferredoxin
MSWKRSQTKNKRSNLTGGKSISSSCRNNGSCKWCRNNRTISILKNEDKIRESMLDMTLVD